MSSVNQWIRWTREGETEFDSHEGLKDLFLNDGTEILGVSMSAENVRENEAVPLFWRPSPEKRLPKPDYSGFLQETSPPVGESMEEHVERIGDRMRREAGHTGGEHCPKCAQDSDLLDDLTETVDSRGGEVKAKFDEIRTCPRAMEFCRMVAATSIALGSGAETDEEIMMANANAMLMMTGVGDDHPVVLFAALAMSNMIIFDQDYRDFYEVLKQPRPYDFNLKVLSGQLRAVNGLKVVRVSQGERRERGH